MSFRWQGDQHRQTNIHVHVGGHVEKPQDDVMYQLCQRAVEQTADLHHIAFYTDRVLDFAMDVLGDERDRPAGASTADRSGLRRLGRQLCHEFERLDKLLREARTGALIRTVLRTADAEIVCDPVVRKQFVVGTTYTEGHDYIDDANNVDRSVAGLVRDLRKQLGLTGQNVGGYDTEHEEPETGWPRHEPHVETVDGDSVIPPEIEMACRDALDPAYLHLVTYCIGDEVVYLADTFEHPSMRTYFGRETTPLHRRAHFRRLSGQLSDICSSLNRVSAQTLRGRLKRIVLDVEQGAVYYYRLDNGAQLVGVTLYQPRVHHADVRMARLARECDIPLASVTE
jgi:hypothetical protein